MNPVQPPTDEDLLLKLRSTEHDFLERKPLRQKGEWLQVAVAFANSAPIGWPAVLFVGVDDQGTPQEKPEKLEDLSKSINSVLDQAYPPIYRDVRPLVVGDQACLAVVIPGSEARPHFAGKSYVRVGPETREASEKQFEALIASRSSKVYEMQSCKDQLVTFVNRAGEIEARLVDCNSHFVSLKMPPNHPDTTSYPVTWIELSYDHGRGRLMLRADR